MNTQIVFNIDSDIKTKAMKRAKAAGVPFAAVLKLATKAYADGELALGIGKPERFNAKTARELRAILKDAKEGKNISPAFDNVRDAIEWLEKGDV